MKRIEFIVEAGRRDSSGDIILLRGIRNPNDKVPLLREFDTSKSLGSATLKLGDVLRATADIEDEHLDLVPAIHYEIGKDDYEYNAEEYTTTIKRCRIHSVGLCMKPNSDKQILSLRDQLMTGQAKEITGLRKLFAK